MGVLLLWLAVRALIEGPELDRQLMRYMEPLEAGNEISPSNCNLYPASNGCVVHGAQDSR